MSDERRYNKKGGPNIFHKLRKIVTGNKSGDVYGVTIPQHIANDFFGCYLKVSQSGGMIILESGCNVINRDNTEDILKSFLSNKYKEEMKIG